jgi:hypothetical protein
MTEKQAWRPFLAGAVALAALTAVGCAGEAVQFNNAIANSAKKVEAAEQPVVTALQAGNLAEAKRKAEGLLGTVDQARKDLSALRVPAQPGAKEFADSYKTFLAVVEECYQGDLSRLLGPEAPRLQERLTAAVKGFQQRQKEFASKSGFQLEPQ